MEWIRPLDPACDSQGTAPREGADSNQVHHEAKAESRLHPVTSAETSERTVIRDASPALLATRDHAEAIIEGNTGLDLGRLRQPLCFDGDNFHAELRALCRPEAPHLLEHRGQNYQSPHVGCHEFKYFQRRVPIIDEDIRIGEKHRFDHLDLPRPLTRLTPHLFAGQAQDLGCPSH